MKVNCYKTAFQIYIIYALLPFMHALPSVIRISMIALAFMMLGMHVISCLHKRESLAIMGLMFLTFVYTLMIFYGEYSVTIFGTTFGISKFLMLFLFWFPIYFLPGMGRECGIDYNKIYKLVVTLSSITALTTLIGILRFDEPCRQLAKQTSELTKYYQSLNIGGYGFIYTLIFLIPTLWIRFKNSRKIRYVFLIILYMACIVGSSYGTAFIVLVITLGVFFAMEVKCNGIVKAAAAIVLIGTVYISGIWLTILKSLSGLFERMEIPTLALRLDQIYRSILTARQTGGLADRTFLRNQSLEVFQKNVFLGNLAMKNKQPLGMHSELCDVLGGTGIIGSFVLFILIGFIIMYLKKQIVTNRVKNMYIALGVSIAFLAYFNTVTPSLEIMLIVIVVLFAESIYKKDRRI